MNIDERKLRRIVSESIEEMLNAPYRNSPTLDSTPDGKYRYIGAGTPESDDRVKKIRKKIDDRAPGDNPYFSRPGQGWRGKDDSIFSRMGREYGDLKTVTTKNNSGEGWNMFITYLRNNASRKYGSEDNSRMLNYYASKLNTREGAASFIKYLYMNGFDPQSKQSR